VSDFTTAVIYHISVSVQFFIQVSILFPAVLIKQFLLINFASESLNKSDIAFNSSFVIVVHATTIFIESSKLSLEGQQLIL
jgi:hypothetical protein